MEPSPKLAINPLLLVAACSGNRERLNILLNSQQHAAAGDDDLIPAYASFSTTPESLLKGVTVEGDTALHAVASNGDGHDFLSSANLIYGKAEHLLFVQNKRGDTPLHLAARAGNYKMVSHLIDLANEIVVGVSRPTTIAAARVKKLLETQNKLNETALHEVIRIGSEKMVSLLMDEDPELARIPEEGTSPLYLAILLEKKIIAETLHEKSGGVLSYSGPNEQNALHAAVRRGPDLTKLMLKWNKDLTTQTDENGSTPLHFAADQVGRGSGSVCEQLVEANPAALYQSDHDGLFPIQVAASVDARNRVAMFVNRCPGTAGLRGAKGRTFLLSLLKVLETWWYFIFLCLQNSQALINDLFMLVGARRGASRHNPFNNENINKDGKESEMIKETTNGMSIGTVLIATVTFGATFALPGGYIEDDHKNEGTPTRAGRYAFDAFMIANTVSFVCSSVATVGFMFSGSSIHDLVRRKFYLRISFYLMQTSITSLAATFALGVYTVLAPVAHKTATAICVLSSLVVLSINLEFWAKKLLTLPPLVARNGLLWTIVWFASLIIGQAVGLFWPIIFAFGWAAYPRTHP